MRSSLSRPTVAATSFIAAYAANKARLTALEASYADAPNGDTLWEILQLCARTYKEPGASYSTPRKDGVRSLLRWLTAGAELVSKYPDHPRVQSGAAIQRFALALRRHELYEKAVEVLEAFTKNQPTSRGYQQDDAHWDMILVYGEMGVFYDELGDKKRALKVYQAALTLVDAHAKKFPKDSRSNAYTSKESGRTTAALTNRHAATLMNVIARVRSGR
jgi:tetratricopeptide (TPR) repeat protein